MIADSVRAGVGLLTWETDSFAYAEGYDEERKRYVGLRARETLTMPLTADDRGLVVRPEVARRQLDREVPPALAPIVEPEERSAPTPRGGEPAWIRDVT